jgi:penicillin-binding protein 2
MSKQNPKEVTYDFDGRMYVLLYIALIIFLSLGIRFYVLQIVRHEDYQQRAENNRIRDIPIIAPRGAIFDRNGKLLVDNQSAFNLVIYPELMTNSTETIKALVDNFKVEEEFIRTAFNDPKRPKSLPVLVKQNAERSDMAWVAAHEYEHPEISIEEQPQRIYPYGKLASHALGYVGEISTQQLESPKYAEAGYKQGDVIGQGGLEATYDKILRGRNGVKRMLVDSRGRPIRVLSEIPPTKGQDLITTIDLDIQQVAEEQFDKSGDTGVAIATNPQNGEVLAMVSRPAFDPNIFALNIATGGEKRKDVRALLIDPTHPLHNDAIQGRYPTGSTWKLLMSAAALEEGIITPKDSRIVCGGGIQMGNRFVHCTGNHGAPDIHTAIVKSCDGYYYRLGLKMGVDMINNWATKFGAGPRTGIDLPSEIVGIIPSREWKRRVNKRDPEWKDFDTVLASIGQGSVAITPMQLLYATSGIMMGGQYYKPHLLKEAKETPIEPVKHFTEPPSILKLSQQTIDIVSYGAWGVVNEGGTAGGLLPRDLNVGGKTGTAQVIAKEKVRSKEHRDHAWFVSFAPLHTEEKPEFAVVVLTENGGWGGRASAPKAKMIHAAYFSKKFGRAVIPEYVAKADGTPPPAALQVASTGVPIETADRPRRPVNQ